MHSTLNQLVVRAFMAVKAANERTDIPNTIAYHRVSGAYRYAKFVLELTKGHKSLTYIQLGEETEKLAIMLNKHAHWNKNSNGDKRGDRAKTIFGYFDGILWSNRPDATDNGEEALRHARDTMAVIFDFAFLEAAHYSQVRYRLFSHLQHALLPRADLHGAAYRAKVNALLAGYVLTDLSID